MSASAIVGGKFAPISDRMRVYRLVRETVDAKRFTTLKDLTEELKSNGYTLPSRVTIKRWVRGETSPFSGKRMFDSHPSEELSFFLGAWIGDGWSDDNDGGKRMLLQVRSYDFAKEFARSAEKILQKSDSYWVRRVINETGAWYFVKVTCFMMYDFVNHPLDTLKEFIKPFPKGFLRGFFTAEGNPSASIERTNGPFLHIGLVVANSDYKLLEYVRGLLSNLGFHPGGIRLNISKGMRTNLGVARSPGWLLSLSRLDDARVFASTIGFADPEKQSKLTEAISLIDMYGPSGAGAQWIKYYEKRGKKWVRKGRSSISS